MKATVSLGCDHAGFALKSEVAQLLADLNCMTIDRGCYSHERVDYPDYAALVAQDVQSGKARHGILICGTGVGMAICANKFRGVRAANLVDEYSTLMARKHNDANVLCLGARVIGPGTAVLLVGTFLKTEFEGGRHQDRVAKILEMEDLCMKP